MNERAPNFQRPPPSSAHRRRPAAAAARPADPGTEDEKRASGSVNDFEVDSGCLSVGTGVRTGDHYASSSPRDHGDFRRHSPTQARFLRRHSGQNRGEEEALKRCISTARRRRPRMQQTHRRTSNRRQTPAGRPAGRTRATFICSHGGFTSFEVISLP